MSELPNKGSSLLRSSRERLVEKMLCDAVEVKLESTLALRRRAEEMAGAPGPKSDDQAACGEVHHALCSCHLNNVKYMFGLSG